MYTSSHIFSNVMLAICTATFKDPAQTNRLHVHILPPTPYETRSSATAEIAHVCGYYAVQGHSNAPIFAGLPIESSYATSY